MLVQEQDQVQRPIYFVSNALQGLESRYQSLEKAAGGSITTFIVLQWW